MLTKLIEQRDRCLKELGELEALVDLAGRADALDPLVLEDLVRVLKVLRDQKERSEEFVKVINRSIPALSKVIARKMTDRDCVSIEVDGHLFSAQYVGHYSIPSSKKDPKAYAACVEALKAAKPLPGREAVDIVQEETIVKVGDEELKDYCRAVREAGRELPHGVREHPEFRIKIRRK